MKQMLIIIFILAIATSAFSKEPEYYWIDGGVKVLTFLGKPHARVHKAVRFETFKKQKIQLLHKKSGPGVYAFTLKGLVVKDREGYAKMLWEDGFFVAKRGVFREKRFAKKISLKYKTKKPPATKPEEPQGWWWKEWR